MTINRRNVESKFQGNTLNVMRAEVDISKSQIDLEYVERKEVSLVIPILDDGKIVMIRQYRVSVNQELIEFPGGKIEPGETPLEAAKRELEEETGFVASYLQHLVSFYSAPHFTDEKIRIFLAKGLTRGQKLLETEELIKTIIIDYADLKGYLKNSITDAKTLLGINELKKLIDYEAKN